MRLPLPLCPSAPLPPPHERGPPSRHRRLPTAHHTRAHFPRLRTFARSHTAPVGRRFHVYCSTHRYERLTPAVVIDRLINRHHHLLAEYAPPAGSTTIAVLEGRLHRPAPCRRRGAAARARADCFGSASQADLRIPFDEGGQGAHPLGVREGAPPAARQARSTWRLVTPQHARTSWPRMRALVCSGARCEYVRHDGRAHSRHHRPEAEEAPGHIIQRNSNPGRYPAAPGAFLPLAPHPCSRSCPHAQTLFSTAYAAGPPHSPFFSLFFALIRSSRAEPSRAEPSRAEPSRAEPSRAEPSRALPSIVPPCRILHPPSPPSTDRSFASAYVTLPRRPTSTSARSSRPSCSTMSRARLTRHLWPCSPAASVGSLPRPIAAARSLQT